MRTMKQRGSFGQEGRAYAKAPLGIRLNRILGMRQNACNRFHTALYEHAQSSASQSRKVYSATDRRALRRTGRVDLTSARAVSVGRTVTGHVQSLRDNRATHARSVGSRILAAGLLPLPQLRCSSCQGLRTLTQIRPGLSAFWCKRHFENVRHIRDSLHGPAHLSQRGLNRLWRVANPFTREPCEALS